MTRLAWGWLLAGFAVAGCEPEQAGTRADDAALTTGDAARPPPDAMRLSDARPPPEDDFGQACTDGAQCRSSYCIVAEGDERVCTRLCGNDTDCPEGWLCRQVVNAGVDVAFVCVPEEAPCAGVDLQTDPNHCGACGQACAYPNAMPRCESGTCAMGPCEPGFHDLDADPANGCEYACLVTRGGVEACDQIDNDCDRAIDEGFDLQSNVDHCGACGAACRPANALPACVEGQCTILSCAAEFVDRDGDPANGCEAGACTPSNDGVEACDRIDNDCDGAIDEDFDLATDPAHCGACGAACRPPNADGHCAGGVCVLDACRPDFYDRDADPANGCEAGCQRSNGGVERCDEVDNDCDFAVDEDFDLAADPRHCGGCGNACDRPGALTTCQDGACVFLGCAEGFVDLDDDPANGCEYACRPAADPGEVCNGADDDCDGTVDEGYDLQADLRNCGACGRACAADNADATCDAGRCVIAACANGFVDRDGMVANGCECRVAPETCDGTDEDCDGRIDEDFDFDDDPEHCGGCHRLCELPRATERCVRGLCRIEACEQGFVDLDTDPVNGCECFARPEACNGADEDCDGRIDEGFDLQNDPRNCGACGESCDAPNAVTLCREGACAVAGCNAGFVDADDDPANGCEVDCANGGQGTPGCGPLYVYDGEYDLVPRVQYSCSAFGSVVFSMNFNRLRFDTGGGVLVVSGANTVLQQQPAPADGNFNARGVVGAGGAFTCVETHILTGRFDEANRWTGTFQIQFAGSACDFTNCVSTSFPITGTRR